MLRRHAAKPPFAREERGQASLLILGVVGALLAGAVVLFAFGNALGAKGRHQRAADLAAISAAQVMRELYPRLFEPPFIEPDVPNPRHLEEGEYRAAAVAAAVRGGRRNGVVVRPADVSFPGSGFAPTRVTVRVRGEARVRFGPGRHAAGRVPVRARARAELLPATGEAFPGTATGGGYDGPLAYRQGEPMRPDVALAFDRMAKAAREEAGLFLLVTSGFRSDAEQARLFAAQPKPHLFSAPLSHIRVVAGRIVAITLIADRAKPSLAGASRPSLAGWRRRNASGASRRAVQRLLLLFGQGALLTSVLPQ